MEVLLLRKKGKWIMVVAAGAASGPSLQRQGGPLDQGEEKMGPEIKRYALTL